MQLLHYILKCIHLEWRWLFGPFRYMLIQTVWLIVYIISIPDEELFSETAVGCTASYFVKIIWCSCWFWSPPPYIEAGYCLFCGRRRVAVARYRMICLVLVNSHLFPLPCGAGNAVPREGFDLSVIILASLLVFPMLGCRHSLLRLLAIFQVFVKWNAHFQTFLLVNTCQSGVIT